MLQRGAILSGKYRVDAVLGEGGMAVVYAVTHLRNTARLAVKMLHADSVLKSNIRARFVREGKVANSVNHPGAVQMIDDGVAEDGSPYLVMEHLNGVCVAELSPRSLPLSAALNIAYQVLDVLRAAHENGIIHRDIKPANLFVLRDGRVKVLDFGISRLHDGAEPFDSAATGSVMGTPFFMAPEQARAEPSEIDTRTDVFAVGATLFTLISGKYLHTGEESRQVVIQAATRQARSLASVAAGVPQTVIDLVAKAVDFDSAARWQSAQAMQEAVREVHESLSGPIGFEALATLVLAREFRRKSHAKLTRLRTPFAWLSAELESSPLSTTLPAVAGVTRSRDSFDPARGASPNDAAPSGRPSEAPELAGWTGQVPARPAPKPNAASRPLAVRFAARLSKKRALRSALFAAAVFALLVGRARLQTPARVTAKAPLISEPSLEAITRSDPARVDTTVSVAELSPAPLPARSSVRRSLRAASPAKGGPSAQASAGKAPSKPLPTSATSEPLNDLPTLISPLEPVVR